MGRRILGLTCRSVKERAVQSAAIPYIRPLWDLKTIKESWKTGFIVILMKTHRQWAVINYKSSGSFNLVVWRGGVSRNERERT